MATIYSVIKGFKLRKQVLGPVHSQIAELDQQYADILRPARTNFLGPSPAFSPSAVSELISRLTASHAPTFELAQTWAACQSQLLQVTSLLDQMKSPFNITSQMLQRTNEIIRSIDQSMFDFLTEQPPPLTEKDQERVRELVDQLTEVAEAMPDDEGRAWIRDTAAIVFFAPATEAIDSVGDEPATEMVISVLETAFIAAELAGELWDQR
ncbi:hypothetical protein [Streptomyces ochraceiscleroticus]|uniref:Uncharacterized protein n=1 Tax=Streptomyces ochraceiscleroticus TaxID=47761 RepID=A0ABW1MKX5_9ACTN|nr:hypothetical protein [Streptomyces ochraceiscleroticus]